MLPFILDHLWQSTLLALGLGLLALAFRRASAGVRHGLWFAASAKFLIPFAALAMAGRLVGPAIPLPAEARPEAALIAEAAGPFSQPALAQGLAHGPDLPAPPLQAPLSRTPAPPTLAHDGAPAATIHPLPRLDLGLILLVIGAVWALGSAATLAAWAARWRRLRRVLRSARRLDWAAPMPVLAAPSLVEPGLVGLWRPVLLVPETLPERLSRTEIDALVAHEACHLRRRDNLTAALHMLVEALFWFHPLVWWIGARMIDEREQACDEAVVRAGHDRAAYARSLVEICRLYLQSPLDCVAGASGSNLKTRVEAIMTAPPTSPLSRARKALLLGAGACAFATPVAAGLLTTPEAQKAVARAEAVVSRAVPVRIAAVDGRAADAPSAPDRSQAAKPVVLAGNAPIVGPGLTLARLDAPVDGVTRELPAPPAAGPPADDVAGAPGPSLTLVAAPADAKPELADFIKSYGEAFWNTDNLICIRVEGLPSDKAAAVKARVEADARAMGVGVGRAECSLRYQVEIRFAADAERAVGDVLNYYHHPVWPFPLDRPQGADRPIKAWYGMVYDQAGAPRGSRNLGANPSARQKLALAIVVVDPARTQGQSLDTVSDYVTMLALSQPRALDRCNVLPSITDLYAGACPGRSAPAGLTAADAAYLKALYTGSAGIRATRSPSELVEGMAKRLGAAAPQAAAAPAVQPAVAHPAPPRLPLTPIALSDRPADLSRQSAAFVRSYAAATRGGPQGIPRWRGAVRIQVAGLPAEQNSAVEARIRAVAKAVGAPGAGLFPPNQWQTEVAVIFAADPQRVLDDIARRKPYLLGDQDSVKTVTRPVQAWYQIDDQTDLKGYGSILVIVDLRRTRGVNLGLLADYAAMMALSQPQAADRCQALPSVMDLFAGPCPGRAAPQGLTAADDSYLTALYGGASIYSAVYPDEVAARMAKILASPTDPTLRQNAEIMIGNSNIRRSPREMGVVDR